MAMGSGAAWANVGIENNDDVMYIAQSDVKDFFYALTLWPGLATYFSLPPVPNDLRIKLGGSLPAGQTVPASGWVWPHLRVVPMGWSWAFWVAQRVHQHIALSSSGLGVDRPLLDHAPAPLLACGTPVILPYCDNLNVAGLDKDKVQLVKDKVVSGLRRAGFLAHEELDATTAADSLGYRVDGAAGTVQPAPAPLARLVSALRWVETRPRVTGRQLERLVGHIIHKLLLRRESLSIPRACYEFINQQYKQACKVWPSVAKEIRWIRVLLPLSSAELRRPWSSQVTMSDASLSGFAVAQTTWEEKDARAVARRSERSRYRGKEPAARPRDEALPPRDPFSDCSTVIPLSASGPDDPYELNPDYCELSHHMLREADWVLQYAVPVRIPEPIGVLEARGVVSAVRRELRAQAQFRCRHLHIGDNLGNTLAWGRGRGSSFPLLTASRRLAAYSIGANSKFYHRWVPSELNVCDKASRKWEASRKARATRPGGREASRRSAEHLDQGSGTRDAGPTTTTSTSPLSASSSLGTLHRPRDGRDLGSDTPGVRKATGALLRLPPRLQPPPGVPASLRRGSHRLREISRGSRAGRGARCRSCMPHSLQRAPAFPEGERSDCRASRERYRGGAAEIRLRRDLRSRGATWCWP